MFFATTPVQATKASCGPVFESTKMAFHRFWTKERVQHIQRVAHIALSALLFVSSGILAAYSIKQKSLTTAVPSVGCFLIALWVTPPTLANSIKKVCVRFFDFIDDFLPVDCQRAHESHFLKRVTSEKV